MARLDVAGLRNDLEIRLAVEQHPQATAHHRVIICENEPNISEGASFTEAASGAAASSSGMTMKVSSWAVDYLRQTTDGCSGLYGCAFRGQIAVPAVLLAWSSPEVVESSLALMAIRGSTISEQRAWRSR